mmetsp:Transcript_4030/g.9443  ORF Transcript_4030/g.9443 Transcript_4030/m.9443 type:complete len:339 (+) Transcript_4030:31-1047(+)
MAQAASLRRRGGGPEPRSPPRRGTEACSVSGPPWRCVAAAAVAFQAVLLVLMLKMDFWGGGALAGLFARTAWASSSNVLRSPLQQNVSCAESAMLVRGSCHSPRRSGRCARFVVDDALRDNDLQELVGLVRWLIREAWGAGAGPPSVIDLHANTISYKDKFVDLESLMEFKSLNFTDSQIRAYSAVRWEVRRLVADLFGIPVQELRHDLTFFSHINASKVAQTPHDEYWHTHTDTEQYGTFSYTALVYLSTMRQDFDGGEFIFEGAHNETVEPRFGRLVTFTSDAENPHRVEKVSRGVRVALTAAFTCDTEKAASIEPFPKSTVMASDETESELGSEA